MNRKWKFGWCLAALAVLGFLLYSFLSFTIREVKDNLEIESYGQSIEDYDYYLYAGEYLQMRWRLNNANPRGEEFQLYWDVADAYSCYELCRLWRLAEEAGGVNGNAGQKAEEAAEGNGLEAPDSVAEMPGDNREKIAAGSVRAVSVTEEDCARYEEKYREQLLHIYESSGEQARRYIRSFAGELLP